MNPYIIQTQRLGLRNWQPSDLPSLCSMNDDDEVMRFFPSKPDKQASEQFVSRMQAQFKQYRYCYFAVELLATQEFLGFIGLAKQEYEANFTPCVDIGWRLNRKAWGKGYATEGAKACLTYAFETLQLPEVYSVAPVINTPSEGVMKKIGMQKVKTFQHGLLKGYPKLEECLLYLIKNPTLKA